MRGTFPILVAGRTGQVARSLAEEARWSGIRLVALGRPDLNLADARSIGRAVAAIKPCLIINAAAYTAVDKAESEPAPVFTVNRDGAGQLATAAATAQVPLIHISTDYVFDGLKPSPYVENDPPAPLGIYGRSKLEGEAAVREACPRALVLRTSWLYSPYGQNFVRTMLRLAGSRDEVRVVADQRGTPTAARDIAAAILKIAPQMLAGRCDGGLYHLAANGSTTWHGLAAAIFANWSRRGRRVPMSVKPITTAEYPLPARRPANSQLDCGKIERDLGVRLPHWEASLSACLDRLAAAAPEAPSC
jgi:dTDP-4-dehydrorhamnose reductase